MNKIEAPIRPFVKIISDEFNNRCNRNAKYSLRAFARDLDLNPTSLSLFLRGMRSLSTTKVKEISKKLELTQEVLESELNACQNKNTFSDFSEFQIMQLGEWHYFALISLIETSNFISDREWIAQRLQISVETAEEAIAHLSNLEIIHLNEETGEIVLSGKNYSIPDQKVANVVRHIHSQSLELARRSLDSDPIDERNFSSIVMAVEKNKLPEAFRRIKKFRHELAHFLEKGENKDEVYKLSIQLFPLSKSD